LSCDGAIEILLQPLNKADALVISALQGCRQQREPAILLIADSGLQLVIDVQQPHWQPWLQRGKSAWCHDQQHNEPPKEQVFACVYLPPFALYVVGAGHIAQFLLPMAQMAAYQVTVIDPRAAFITEQRFAGVKREHAWPDESTSLQQLDRQSAVVCLSHDPKIDDPALELALASEALYIGALGSRNTHAKRIARLSERGFAEQVHRIHGPVGLALGGRAPAEIAIAILAQLTQLRYQQGQQP
jgi:xanthine dehydrogenase accessory factor